MKNHNSFWDSFRCEKDHLNSEQNEAQKNWKEKKAEVRSQTLLFSPRELVCMFPFTKHIKWMQRKRVSVWNINARTVVICINECVQTDDISCNFRHAKVFSVWIIPIKTCLCLLALSSLLFFFFHFGSLNFRYRSCCFGHSPRMFGTESWSKIRATANYQCGQVCTP